MKFIIKDTNEEIVLGTTDIDAAYDYLCGEVPENHICTLDKLKAEMLDDKIHNRQSQRYSFQKSDNKFNRIYLDIEYC